MTHCPGPRRGHAPMLTPARGGGAPASAGLSERGKDTMSSLWSYPPPRINEHLDELNLSAMPRQIAPATRPVAVMVDGPFAAQDAYGDEYPEWTVSLVDSEGDDTGKSYTCRSFRSAINLGTQIADDRHLELVNEAMRA